MSFGLNHIPRLEVVVCMGEEAWEVTATLLGITTSRDEARAARGWVAAGHRRVAVVPHPAARPSNVVHEGAWARVQELVAS